MEALASLYGIHRRGDRMGDKGSKRERSKIPRQASRQGPEWVFPFSVFVKEDIVTSFLVENTNVPIEVWTSRFFPGSNRCPAKCAGRGPGLDTQRRLCLAIVSNRLFTSSISKSRRVPGHGHDAKINCRFNLSVRPHYPTAPRLGAGS